MESKDENESNSDFQGDNSKAMTAHNDHSQIGKIGQNGFPLGSPNSSLPSSGMLGSDRKRNKRVLHDDNALDDILGQITSKLDSLSTNEDARKEELVRAFIDVLSCTPDEAAFFLDSAAWSIEAAVSLWLEYNPHTYSNQQSNYGSNFMQPSINKAVNHSAEDTSSLAGTYGDYPEDGYTVTMRRAQQHNNLESDLIQGRRFNNRSVEIIGLPEGWVARVNPRSGHVYFTFVPTGVVQECVPPGFAERTDGDEIDDMRLNIGSNDGGSNDGCSNDDRGSACASDAETDDLLALPRKVHGHHEDDDPFDPSTIPSLQPPNISEHISNIGSSSRGNHRHHRTKLYGTTNRTNHNTIGGPPSSNNRFLYNTTFGMNPCPLNPSINNGENNPNIFTNSSIPGSVNYGNSGGVLTEAGRIQLENYEGSLPLEAYFSHHSNNDTASDRNGINELNHNNGSHNNGAGNGENHSDGTDKAKIGGGFTMRGDLS